MNWNYHVGDVAVIDRLLKVNDAENKFLKTDGSVSQRRAAIIWLSAAAA